MFSRFEAAFYVPNPESGETLLGATYGFVEPTVVSMRTSLEQVSQLGPVPLAVDETVLLPSRVEMTFPSLQPVVLS